MTNSELERTFEDKQLQYLQSICDRDNARKGSLTDYDCEICKNKGKIYYMDGNHEVVRRCECMEIRDGIQRMKRSGLYDSLDVKTFDTFRTNEQWQKDMLDKAKRFTEKHDKPGFFIGGQPGAGKTHLCTAICKGLMDQNFGVQYFVWETDVKKILSRSGVSDREERESLMKPLLQSPVIYLDDFLRKESPTQAESSIAFDVINRRYIEGKITIISSEHTINDLLNKDQAIASRIKEMCGDTYCLNISSDTDKNYRLNNGFEQK